VSPRSAAPARPRHLWRTSAVVLLVGATIFPIYWMAVSATTDTSRLFVPVPDLLPNLTHLSAFRTALTETQLARWLVNSAIIAIGTTLLSVAVAWFAAYALSRYRFRGRGLFGLALFITQFLPEVFLLVPLYGIFLAAGLLNRLEGLMIINAAFVVPVATWLLKSAIDAVPREIEEAARVDGAPRLAIQIGVVAPLVLPSLAAVAVIAFFQAWDEFVFALTFLSKADLKPASVGIASFVGELTTPMDVMLSASLIYVLPTLLFAIFAQRYVVSGLVSGSVKE
jgi:multiple sugar transport system permease protein